MIPAGFADFLLSRQNSRRMSSDGSPMSDGSADKRPLSEVSAENRPLCEGLADICRLYATFADIQRMFASSARGRPLSADVRRHPPHVRLLCRQRPDVRHVRREGPTVRHPARESVPGARERDTVFGPSTARTYKSKCQNRPFSHPAPPPPASGFATRPQGPQVQKVQKPSARPFWTF